MQVSKLRAYHYTAQTKPEKAGLSRYGLDLIKGALRNNVDAGVLEPALAKVKIIQVRSCVAGKPFTLCAAKLLQSKQARSCFVKVV